MQSINQTLFILDPVVKTKCVKMMDLDLIEYKMPQMINFNQSITHFILGFSGQNCSVNIDDCDNHMCQNGGSCVDGINKYTCECPAEFTGKFCEIEPMVAQVNIYSIYIFKNSIFNNVRLSICKIDVSTI